MSESKFTPGPWIECSCGCELVWGADGETTIHHSPDNRETRTASGEESQANARLISAAPDLYEALKCVLEDIQNLIDDDAIVNIMDDVLYVKARAALAKAEGKT